jgi:integrase
MKLEYPSYQRTGTAFIYDKLSTRDKKVLGDFIEYCSISAGAGKIRTIKATMLQIRDIVGKSYDNWDVEIVRKFLAVLNRSSYSEWTKNDIKKFLKKFIKWYYKDLEMIEDIKQVSMMKAFNHEKINESTLVKPEELKILLKATDSLKWRAIITLLAESGCRPQELRVLRWKDIRFTDDGADITLFSEKKREARTIPIRDCVVHLKRWKQEYIKEDIKPDYYVFPYNDPEKQMCGDILNRHFNRACSKAGIRNINPYMFRHTKLTFMYNKLPEQVVKKYAGHSKSSKMTEIYSHISNKDVRDIVLKEIYDIKEITEDERKEYDKKFEIMGKEMERLAKESDKIRKVLQAEQKGLIKRKNG